MNAKRHWLRILTLTAVSAAILLAVGLGAYRAGKKTDLTIETPTGAYCRVRRPNPNDSTSVDRRNLVWRSMNDDPSLPESPEKLIGKVIRLLISSNVEPEFRAQMFTVYLFKSNLYLAQDEMDEAQKTLTDGEPLARAVTLRHIAEHDFEAADLILQILSDQKRMTLLAAGKPIPLEGVPEPE